MQTQTTESTPILVVDAQKRSFRNYLSEVWQERRLIRSFAIRELKTLYAQTVLGILWTAIQPIVALLVFAVFFMILSPVNTDPIPYPVFAFTGLVAWYFFTALVSRAGRAVNQHREIIADIYFPKLILPLSKSLVGLVEFGITLVILMVLLLFSGQIPGWEVVLLPVFMLMNLVVGLTIGLWISALSYRFRDFQILIPFLVNFGIWLTPVFYPTTLIPEKYAFLQYLNPMAGVIEGYRWTLFGGTMPGWEYAISFGATAILGILGVIYFFRVEHKMIDL